jgi:hypothetical protein
MSVRDAITVVGTAVGAYFGYPQLGYAIGSALGNAVDPQTIKGPSLGDISRQTSMEGVPRPIVWALSPPMAGNIIASSEPKIVRKRQRQGKGGPKVETEHVYRTYAVGVCEGTITRFVRIWRNNTLVYDVSEFPLKTQAENTEFLKHARFFLGSFTQNASPALERSFGVGTTPSHRGTAYMVMDDEELTDLRGAIPQYQFQVERCEGFFLTSRPYPAEDLLALNSFGSVDDVLELPPPTEALAIYGFVNIATMPVLLVRYEDWPAEALDSYAHIQDASLVVGAPTIIVIDDQDPEALDSSGEVISGEMYEALIRYSMEPEALDITGSVVSATLE